MQAKKHQLKLRRAATLIYDEASGRLVDVLYDGRLTEPSPDLNQAIQGCTVHTLRLHSAAFTTDGLTGADPPDRGRGLSHSNASGPADVRDSDTYAPSCTDAIRIPIEDA